VYFQTIKFEKTEWNELITISKNDFENLAENKSASLCYPLVDALESLQRQNTQHGKLLKDFLKHLHIAFQYQDDVDDFKKDKNNNQRTYAQFLVEKRIKENGISKHLSSPEMQYKYLFTSAIASQLLTSSNENYKACLAIAHQLNLKALADFVQQESICCEGQLNEIEFLLEKTKVKAQKSNTQRFSKPILNVVSIENALSESINYLEKNIDEEKLWTDFMTTAGTSKYWVTFYTAYQLADSGINLPLLKDLSQRISDSQLKGSYSEPISIKGYSLAKKFVWCEYNSG